MLQRIMVFLLFFGLTAHSAQAHYLWLCPTKATAGATAEVQLCFAEYAEPGEAHLLQKVDGAKKWLYVGTASKSPEVKWEKQSTADTACWTAKLPDNKSWRVETSCDYGVLARPEQPVFRLNYFAKTLSTDALQSASYVKAKNLDLDILPELVEQKLTCTVHWQGQPLSDVQYEITCNNKALADGKTNAAGQFVAELPSAGLVTIQIKQQQKVPATEYQGKTYELVKNYSTLTFFNDPKLPAKKLAKINFPRPNCSNRPAASVPCGQISTG